MEKEKAIVKPSPIEGAKKKKHVVIKDVLGDMKETIHMYHSKHDEIDKKTDDKGKKF